MRPLNPRERRLVAVGLLILLGALIWLPAVAPLLNGFSARAEERASLRAAYLRNSRLINTIPAIRRQAEQQKGTTARFAIGGANAALARAALRERLQRDFTAAGGQVTALQDVPATPGEVRAWIQGRMTLPQLQQMLVRVNDTPPYLVTESLRISADRALETGRLDLLDIRLETSIPHIPAAS